VYSTKAATIIPSAVSTVKMKAYQLHMLNNWSFIGQFALQKVLLHTSSSDTHLFSSAVPMLLTVFLVQFPDATQMRFDHTYRSNKRR
jgi:uncharacterized membrane protein